MENFDGYIADIYREMEAELIASMKRNLGLHEAEEALTGLKYPQWQAIKLKELMRFQRENERIMGKKLSGLPEEVSRQMIDELNQGSKHELRRYRKALKKGYKSAKVMKDSFFHIDDRKVQGLINALNNDLARANSAVLRMMNDQYRQTIFKAGMFVSNGVYTEEQAVKKAVEEFEKKGLNCIEYKDGRRVNIADYASMAVRTANQRAYMVGEGEFRKSIGETLVIISRHSTSCDLCKPFEGKVLIDDVYSGGTQEDGDYMLLSEAMAQGLYHPRCRHGLGTYYPELEDINGYETEDNKLNEYKINNSDIAKSEKSDIIKPKQMLRKRANKGAFSGLVERMSKKRIRELAKEYDIDLTGISLNIDFNEELLSLAYTGRADSESVGGITFFPNAFRDKETLLRTLYHELQHVKQFKEFGTEYVQNNLGAFEKLAYEAEDTFVESLRKEGKL
ncbi:MAG: hypothetical protein IKK37_03545 [Clostridia bacterium]|nr:hypothetical protein [Clostridia bacterium]